MTELNITITINSAVYILLKSSLEILRMNLYLMSRQVFFKVSFGHGKKQTFGAKNSQTDNWMFFSFAFLKKGYIFFL